MLYAFGFDRIGVVVSDLYFVDPQPGKGQEGPEQGVRLEVRIFEPTELRGSIYSARPIAIDRPIWRADLLESVANPGSLDRAHHHPAFSGWEPGTRRFVAEMTADPVAWVGARLSDPDRLLAEAGVDASDIGVTDTEDLRGAVPEILAAIRKLFAGIEAGTLARPPQEDQLAAVRASWL